MSNPLPVQSHISAWAARHIHDRTTFSVVLAVAILQLLLAVYGGILAVPTDSKRKWLHRLAFVAVGFMLFFLTFRAGILTDTAQYKADQKITGLQSDLAASRSDEEQALALNVKTFNDLEDLKKTPRGSTIDAATRIDFLNKVDSAQSNILNAVGSLASRSNPPLALPSNNPTLPPNRLTPPATPSQSDAIGNLNRQLDYVATCLHSLDRGLALEGSTPKGSFIGSNPSGPPTEQQLLLVPTMKKEIKDRDEAYSSCSKNVQAVRSDVHTLFRMSPAQIAADDAKFGVLDLTARLPTISDGLTPWQVWGLMYRAKYDAIGNYFSQLKNTSVK